MEKLQKALNKARQERESMGYGPKLSRKKPQVLTPEPEDQVAPHFPGVWSQLSVFEPNPQHLLANRVMTLNAAPVANPFDVLRTKIFLIMRQNGWTRLAITSPNRSCGKTTIACNLAVGFSRQREVKSMLFDLDLRCPAVASVLGHQPEHDIVSMLTGDVSAEQQMVRLRNNVAISGARKPVNDPTQLLLSKKTVQIFNNIQAEFEPDVMIFDLPPMLVTDDTRVKLKNVDCALIVARAEETRMSQLDVCEREVSEHTNVLGVVLNNCRHMGTTEEYYGDYG